MSIKYNQKQKLLQIQIFGIKFTITLNFYKFIIKSLKPLIIILDYITPKSKKKIIFNSCPDFSDNAYAYYKFLQQNYSDKYKLYWIIEKKEYVNPKENRYWLYSFRSIYSILTSKYVVSTHSNYLVELLAPKRHVWINLWHGMPLKTLGFNEVILRKSKFNQYKKLGENSYFFATNDIFKQMLLSCFKAPYHNCFITGQPRTDLIFDNTNNAKAEEIFNFSKYSKVVFYMPTYKENGAGRSNQLNKKYNNIFYMDDYNEASFVKMLEDNNILFVMKPHPFDEKFYKQHTDSLPKSDNFKIVYNKTFSQSQLYLYEVFKYIDLMICDFSSVSLDYLILNRPVVYLDNMTEEYCKNRGMILEDNTKIFMPGDSVVDYKSLEQSILSNLHNDVNKQLREKALPLIHKYTDNKSSERVYEIMKKL